MATIGWIKVGLTADTSKFAKEMKSAAEEIAGFKDRVSGVLGAVAAGLSVGAFATWVKGAMDASDAVHDMAREIGVSNEALSKLHHVAEVAGIDAGTMDSSFQHLNKNLATVARDGGPAAATLARFGLSARQLVNSGPEKSFQTAIDVLAKIPNAAQRAEVATELFGKSGQAMIRLAGEGAGAVAKLGDEAKALGVAISDIDSERIGEANDALGRVWNVVQGLANSIAVQLSPYLTYVADLFVDWAKEGGRAGSIVSQGVDFVTSAIGYAADAVQVLQTGWHYMQASFAEAISYILAGIDKAIQAFGWLYEKVTGTKLALSTLAKDLSDAFEAAAVGELGKAETSWNKKWAHEGVKEFVDGIKLAAQTRAELAAGKEAAFRKGGPLVDKPHELKFAAAGELGSKEAYSSILKARGQQQNSLQIRLAEDTKTTAEATTRAATTLARMADLMTQQNGNQGSLLGAAL